LSRRALAAAKHAADTGKAGVERRPAEQAHLAAMEPRTPPTRSVVCVAIRPEKVKLSRRGPTAEGAIGEARLRRGGALFGGQHDADRRYLCGRPARGGLVRAPRLPGAGTMSARRIFAGPARYAAIAPYVWMVLFFLVPFGFVLKIALSQT
ncbi:hypothetical protein KXV85_003647, partial [Aspergillus fumigatus]